ncbi:MAG: YraN family protein [Lachnospiraceae bacterium]
MENNPRSLGTEKELLAEEYLKKQGFRIVERNFHGRQGEIDLIGYDGDCLVFVEVKYRREGSLENPLEAVGYKKMCRICKTADYYRYLKRIPLETQIRYDVVGIWGEKTEWIQNAFPHVQGR